jgi:PIN domain nuclease of toxin-antitoxin system
VRLLIDTHILLWADQRPRLIAEPLRAAMRDAMNEVVVSAATVWEITIKRAIGKLRFDRPIVAAVRGLGFEVLPVAGIHAEHAGGLPRHHDDPFRSSDNCAGLSGRSGSRHAGPANAAIRNRNTRPRLTNGLRHRKSTLRWVAAGSSQTSGGPESKASASASLTFCTQTPTAPSSTCFSAMTGHLWVLAWGRTLTGLPAIRSARRRAHAGPARRSDTP